jgi:hypothetical protein
MLSRVQESAQLNLFEAARVDAGNSVSLSLRREWTSMARFLAAPAVLGIAALLYNYFRFHSLFDMGYSRIPVIQNEDWFKHGLFSVHAIPVNASAMLLDGWRRVPQWPYLMPSGFGGSILAASPFLLLLVRKGSRDWRMFIACWIAVIGLTLVLWLHANPGGWQFSYRYGMILIPWMFLILLDTGKRRPSVLEIVLFVVSVSINAFATYLFTWTKLVQP